MSNHRKNQRRHLVALARVRDLQHNANPGYIEDLSTSGIMLLTDRAFFPGSVKRVSIGFHHPKKGHLEIIATLRIAWQQLVWKRDEDSQAQYKTGCQIIAISDEDHLALLQAGSAYGLTAL